MANIWGKANIRGLMIECIILFTGRWANNWAGGGGGAYKQQFTVFCVSNCDIS